MDPGTWHFEATAAGPGWVVGGARVGRNSRVSLESGLDALCDHLRLPCHSCRIMGPRRDPRDERGRDAEDLQFHRRPSESPSLGM